MALSNLKTLLAMGTPPAGTQQDPKAQLLGMLGFLVPMGVIFYVLMIRPQQKKAKEHAKMLQSVRRGDEVLTSGGIVGDVVTVKEKTLVVRSAEAKFEVAKSAITEVTKRSGESSES